MKNHSKNLFYILKSDNNFFKKNNQDFLSSLKDMFLNICKQKIISYHYAIHKYFFARICI